MGWFKPKKKKASSMEISVNPGIGAKRAKNRELHKRWDAEYNRLLELVK